MLTEEDGRIIKDFGIEQLWVECFFNGNCHDLGPAQGSHVTELFLLDQFDRFEAKPRRKNTIVRRRRSTALDMSQHRYARFDPRLLLYEGSKPIADSTQLRVTEFIDVAGFREHVVRFIRRRPFGNDNDGKFPSSVDALADQGTYLVHIELSFWDQNAIGSCQIVIDCFGDTDNRITFLAEKLVSNTQRVLAANRYQIIQAKLLPIGLKFLNVVHITEWIGPRRSQDRAAARKDARHGEIRQRLGISMDKTGPSVLDAQNVVSEGVRPPNDRANDGVQAGTIAAAGQDTDFLHVVSFTSFSVL